MGRRVVRTPEGDVTISADSEMLLDLVEQTIVADHLVMAEPEPRDNINQVLGRACRVTRLDDVAQTDADRKGPLFTAGRADARAEDKRALAMYDAMYDDDGEPVGPLFGPPVDPWEG